MHPAPSVIIFTTLSGLGFGLFAFLGLGLPDVSGWVAFTFFALAYALSCAGLVASTFHLGNPKNAIYAFSQWRSSWLSREGIMAVVTLLTFAPVAIGQIFLDGEPALLGGIGSVFAILTVFTTSMIYTQLKTIARWHMPLTPVLFLLYALAGGALLAGQAKLAGVLIIAVTAAQLIAWKQGDARSTTGDLGTATGLGEIGQVRLLESAHTARNYILDEMAFQVGRKHVQKLRMIATVCIGILPALLLLALPSGHLVALIAMILHVVGVAATRWLFFAQAEHVVASYYGR